MSQFTERSFRHQILGWLFLSVFSLLGLLLEALHGFKVDFYLDVTNETRRMMWTLAHTHGTLLGVIHLCFASALTRVKNSGFSVRFASFALTGASVLMPLGFFGGGLILHGDDPGLGILMVPLGGLLLVASLFTTLSLVWLTRPDGASKESVGG